MRNNSTTNATWSGAPSIWGPTLPVRMVLLSISLTGVQMVWGFELAYCSPYLLSLGLSKSMMSLVWIVGPLSGLITQPIVGVLSDRSQFRWGRRRPFMILGSLAAGVGLIVLGWASDIAGMFVVDQSIGKIASIAIAVFALYILDFSINAVQGSCRTLIVDTLPASQQQLGNAWASRMIAIGGVVGYFIGTLEMRSIFGTTFGDTQIKQMCVVSFAALMATVSITCASVTERILVSGGAEDNKGLWTVLKTIFSTMLHLPTGIAAICRIWFFSCFGWFPFMFYSTTFVAEVLQRYDNDMRNSIQGSDDVLGDIARLGATALVVYSSVSLLASFTLPCLVYSPDSEIPRKSRPRQGVVYSVLEFLELYRPDLATAWFIGHLVFAVAMFLTVFIRSVTFATFVIAVCGVPWALNTWAPFAFVGEEINKLCDTAGVHRRRHHAIGGAYAVDTATAGDEEQYVPMMDLSRSPISDTDRPSVWEATDTEASESGNELSGIYLGILNVFACLPQFAASFMSFIVFSILEPGGNPEFTSGGPSDDGAPLGESNAEGVNAIALVMALGGVSVLIAAKETIKFRKMSLKRRL